MPSSPAPRLEGAADPMLPRGCWDFVEGSPGAPPNVSSTGSCHAGSLKRSTSFAAGTPAQQPPVLVHSLVFIIAQI